MQKHYSKLTFLLTLFFISSLATSATAQATGTILGMVLDERTNDPLIGANIQIKGTLAGASSDINGHYVILNVQPGEYTLQVSFVGYLTKEKIIEVNAGKETNVNFQLKESILELDAIVVTGTGYETRKKELTTAITTISEDEIERIPVESIEQVLQGRVAGGSVNINSGQPGTGGRIRIRGVNSAQVSQTPVIYIDGVRMDNGDNYRLAQNTGGLVSSSLSDIMVGDVERIEVTKGGAAATLYGSEAANGVIQIFTKKGKAGDARVTLKMEQGFNSADETFILEKTTKDALLQTGYHQKYSAGISGGSAALTYHLSGYLSESQGVLDKNNDKQYYFRSGFRALLNEDWRVDVSAGLIHNNFERLFNNNHIASLWVALESRDPLFFDESVSEAERNQLIDIWKLPDLNETVNRYTFATTATYEPNPLFSTRLTAGIDYRKSEQRHRIPIEAGDATVFPGGELDRADREYTTVTLDYAGTFKYPQQGDFTSAFTFGLQGFRNEDREFSVNASQFGLDADDFDNTATQAPLESNRQTFNGGFYLNEQVGLYDKVFVNLGFRVDGNTAFGDKVDLVTYPKAGVAYNISDEDFWQNNIKKYAGSFKLRASYGQTGSFPPPFNQDQSFTQKPYLNTVTTYYNNQGNDDLKPEKTSTIEYGFDASFWEEKIGLEFSVFQERTKDALFAVPNQPVSGWGAQLRNVGEIENSGIELALNTTVVNQSNVKLNIRGSFSTLDNKVVDIGSSEPFSIGGYSFLPQRIEEGKPVGVFRTNSPTENGFDTELKYSSLADKYFSLGLNLNLYRYFNFSVLGDGQAGGYVLNTGAVLRYFNGVEPQASLVPDGHNFVTASEVFIEKSDFFKIREISAAYNFPNPVWGLGLKLIASLRNVYTFAEADDFDPELNGVRAVGQVDVGGINFFTLSPPREFRFTIQAEL